MSEHCTLCDSPLKKVFLAMYVHVNLTVCVGIILYSNCALLSVYDFWLTTTHGSCSFIAFKHFPISSLQTSVEVSSPQNNQRRAPVNGNQHEQEHDDHHSNQEFQVNVEPLQIQGQDRPRLAVGNNVYDQGGRPNPLGDSYDV